jgi:hypothetical protein
VKRFDFDTLIIIHPDNMTLAALNGQFGKVPVSKVIPCDWKVQINPELRWRKEVDENIVKWMPKLM